MNVTMTDKEYTELLGHYRKVCGDEGFKKILNESDLDVIIGPGDGGLYSMAAGAGETRAPAKSIESCLTNTRLPDLHASFELPRIQRTSIRLDGGVNERRRFEARGFPSCLGSGFSSSAGAKLRGNCCSGAGGLVWSPIAP